MTNKIILGCIAYILYVAFNDISRVSMWFAGMSFRGISNGVATIRAVLMVKNPTWISVPLERIAGKVYMQDIEIGEIDTVYTSGSIQKKSTTTVPVDILCDLSDLQSSVIANIKSGDVSTLTIRFVGEVTVYGYAFPVDQVIGYKEMMEE